MRAFTDSFIVSNPGQNYTVSELHHCISLREKWLSQPSKRYFSIVVPQIDETSTHVEKTESASKWSKPTVVRWKKILMLQNALLRITRSSHSLSTTYRGRLHSGTYEWTFQALWASKTSCRYQKHCCRQKPPDCLHLTILEADLHLLTARESIWWELKRSSIFRKLLWLRW